MSRIFDQPRLVELAREKSVRGSIVRVALEQAGHVDAEQEALLGKALQELLERFENQEGTQE